MDNAEMALRVTGTGMDAQAVRPHSMWQQLVASNHRRLRDNIGNMNYGSKLYRLEDLRGLVERDILLMYGSARKRSVSIERFLRCTARLPTSSRRFWGRSVSRFRTVEHMAHRHIKTSSKFGSFFGLFADLNAAI
jgi:hypothetical protein